ncbi:MAG: ATP-binding protein, partial [Verrucomicrobiota bacterium]
FGGMQMAWIGMVDDGRTLIRPAASFGSGADYLDGIAIPLQGDDPRGRGPTATAIRENRPVWCQDFQSDPTTALWHEHGARYGWAAYAALPLRKRGKTMGVLVVYSDKANAFDEEVRRLLEEMADDISFAFDGFASDAERKKAEEALKESEERFRLMLQHVPSISVQGYHMDGTTHYWNDASEVIYGYPAQEALGKNLIDLIIPPEMKDGVRLAIKAMAETLQPVPASELTLMRKDGSRVTVYSSHAVIKRHGRDPEFFCLDIDLTDRKLAEEALKELNAYLEEAKVRAEELAVKAESAARAKSEFLALMSHELRTPLNGVLGFAELLSRTRLDEEQQEYTKTIFDSGSHLLDVVNDILDLSSLEKGQMQIEAARIVVSTLVESSCRPIRKLAADKGLDFSFVSAADIPEVITGDIRRIRQILINLLGNAVKFTQKGSVVLRVSPSSLEGRPALDFSVEDTGPGIPKETLADLFKPFTQADSTVSRQFEGTGLGLAISLRIAEAMGGTLDVVSAPGQGSRFTFRFPMDAALPPQPAGGSAAGTATGRVFANTGR